VKRAFEQDVVFGKVSISVHHASHHRFVATCNNSFMIVRQYNFKFKSFFLWSCFVDHGTPTSADCFCIGFCGEQSTKEETAKYMVKCVFLHPLHGQSLVHLRMNTHFFQSSNVTIHGSTLLNYSWNTVITCATVWPVHGVLYTHTLLTTLHQNN
jgi:hypothetical protein